jgi:hypothetical protein
MAMKALSLLQPWASLVAFGEKQFETRSWNTAYRGPLLIHASGRFPKDAIMLCYEEPFCGSLQLNDVNRIIDLPRGRIIAVCDLVDTFRTDEIRDTIGEEERAFGNYEPGRFAFKLDNVRAISPVSAKGCLGLWDVEPAVLATVDLREIATRADGR